MDQNLEKIKSEYFSKIDFIQTASELENIRIEIFGRNGKINQLFSEIKNISPENRKQFGADLNQLKTELENKLKHKLNYLETHHDASLPPKKIYDLRSTIYDLPKIGHLHPVTQTERQLNQVFRKLGFSVYNSPEIVTDEFNFERLNVPKNHPARDMQDSIYIKEPEYLLRTQTSAIEAYLLSQKSKDLPIRAAFPGSVYRNEKVNRSNHFVFHQYQAVVVDKGITMKDLIGTRDLMFNTL